MAIAQLPSETPPSHYIVPTDCAVDLMCNYKSDQDPTKCGQFEMIFSVDGDMRTYHVAVVEHRVMQIFGPDTKDFDSVTEQIVETIHRFLSDRL